jgi:hypothetical protein
MIVVMFMVAVPMIVRVNNTIDVFVRMSMLEVPRVLRKALRFFLFSLGWLEPGHQLFKHVGTLLARGYAPLCDRSFLPSGPSFRIPSSR